MVMGNHNFEIEKIQDTVWVFRNAIKNPQEVLEYFINNLEWTDWYTFGTMANVANFAEKFSEFPTKEEWEIHKQNPETDFGKKGPVVDYINDLFYETTKLYVEDNKTSIDNWVFEGWNVAKYKTNTEYEYAMMHHTDYQREFSHNPGSKFAVTAVFYLNDDYEGGEVMFRFLDPEDINVIKEDYSYKPQAGDIVVFMSGHPHYHGVRAISKGEKYIVRTYWRYNYPGHPLWLKLQEKYGKEEWAVMEEKRVKFLRLPANVQNINNIPFWQSFEEYYKEEIAQLD